MIDRKNTISNLETNIRWIEDIECHQFPGWGNVTMAMRDALELLKEQEAKPVIVTTNAYGTKFYHCPRCNRDLYTYPRQLYCSKCGQELKWQEDENQQS